MTLLKDIMTTQLVVVTPDLSLRDLVDLLVAKHLSGAPVVSGGNSGGKLMGIITLDDIASFQASLPTVPIDGSEEGVWDEDNPPASVEGEESDSAYFQDTWADAGAELVERFEAVRGPEWDFLGEHTVEEAMSRRLLTAAPDEAVDVAARRMMEAEVHRLLVLDQGRLCGIVTTSDVTRAVGQGRA